MTLPLAVFEPKTIFVGGVPGAVRIVMQYQGGQPFFAEVNLAKAYRLRREMDLALAKAEQGVTAEQRAEARRAAAVPESEV